MPMLLLNAENESFSAVLYKFTAVEMCCTPRSNHKLNVGGVDAVIEPTLVALDIRGYLGLLLGAVSKCLVVEGAGGHWCNMYFLLHYILYHKYCLWVDITSVQQRVLYRKKVESTPPHFDIITLFWLCFSLAIICGSSPCRPFLEKVNVKTGKTFLSKTHVKEVAPSHFYIGATVTV